MLDFILNPQFLALLAAMGAGFAGIGKSAQWYIERLDKKNQARIMAEAEVLRAFHGEQLELRDQIQTNFEDRIHSLEVELGIQRELVKQLNVERQLFLKRIYQLEAYIQYSKLSVPELEGWPPSE